MLDGHVSLRMVMVMVAVMPSSDAKITLENGVPLQGSRRLTLRRLSLR